MALVLLKKLKQSQQLTRGEITNLGGGATLTAATKVTTAPAAAKNDPKNVQRQNSSNDLLNSEKLVGLTIILFYLFIKTCAICVSGVI